MRLAADADGRLPQANSQIAGAFDGWTGKEERRRVPWPSETQPNPTQPSHDYFASPKETQQMHRIPANRPQFVSWAALKAQFGQGYGRMDDFRRAFIQTLRLVYGQYQSARFEISAKGMTLYHSLPPVPEA